MPRSADAIPVAERRDVITAGLHAAGVGPGRFHAFTDLTAEIVAVESAWNPRATTAIGETVMQRGLAQLSQWIFDRYRPGSVSYNANDPVASIAALWRFIADRFNVDLASGSGLDEFASFWRDHQTNWGSAPFPVPGTDN